MPNLLEAIASLKDTFEKYAGQDGAKDTLSKKELATLLKNEMGLCDTNKEGDDFLKALDEDGDGVVNFSEYIVFAATLAVLLQQS